MTNDKIVTGDRLEYFKGKLDETYAKKSEISSGADWAAQEGEDGFIENKPFDVPTGSSREIFNSTLEYQGPVSGVQGFTYNGIDSIPELSPSDAGKTVTVTVNGRTLEAVLQYAYKGGHLYYATKDYDMGEYQFLSNESFLLQIGDFPEVSQTAVVCCIPDEVTAGVECTVEISDVSLSKLSGDKIQIDGESIISDNGVLKAVDGGSFVVTCTQSGSNWIADKTRQEIVNAYNSGKLVYFDVNYSGIMIRCAPTIISSEYIFFTSETYGGSGFILIVGDWLNENTNPNIEISNEFWNIQIPKATNDDAGAVKPDGTTITVDENGVISASGGSPVTTTKTLSSSGWTNKTQPINITDVTANSIILVGPDSASSQDWFDDEVRCSAQGNGTLTFVCGNTPTTDITV